MPTSGSPPPRPTWTKHAELQARLKTVTGEREALVERRAAIIVPDCRCAWADASPRHRSRGRSRRAERRSRRNGDANRVRSDIRVHKGRDGCDPATTVSRWRSKRTPKWTSISVDIATVRIRGGRREAQQTAEALEERWSREVAPHLMAANVEDLDGLSAKIAEAQALDASIKAKDAELESLQGQIDSLADSAQKLREASERAKACRAALGDVSPETLLSPRARRTWR